MLKIILSFMIVLLIASSLFLYFMPIGTTEFILSPEEKDYNFSTNNSGDNMQFYENMRFPKKEISYQISNECTLKKKDEAERALDLISNKTVLEFYSVENNGDISVACEERIISDKKGIFVAGEGGPTNITKTDNFNVILHGDILLIRESKCANPNIAIHEFLHALGFDHSQNPNNVMYNISRCSQVLGEDVINKINELYSYLGYPDLSFENASAEMHGRYLDLNLSVRNNGLQNSEKGKIIIYADDDKIKELELNAMKIGFGNTITLGNLWINKININEITIEIKYDFEELSKENNFLKMEIKK
ncbi:MAG: matrixin family metalloprotease [archaeon]